MTDQTPPTLKHDDNDTVEEASSLLFGPGGGGVPARKKQHGVPTITRTRIVTTACVVLGTLAMMLYGGRGRSNTASSGGLATALLLSNNQVAR